MNVIIIGGGKLGYYLARTLIEHGHSPTLVEQDKKTSLRLADELDIPVVCGDGTLIDSLRAAGIKEADALVAVTGEDEQNLVACQLAKMLFGVRRTVAKANNPKNTQVMRQLGIDITVSATDMIARLIEREVDLTAIKQVVSLNQGEASLSEITLPEDYRYDGSRLTDIRLPDQSVIVSIERGGEVIIPRGSTRICSGDKLLIMAKNEVLYKVQEKLRLE
ncbi:MAG: TrkA family potassium uptake protein [Lawsonibacter sp.]|nr:TrkA family potassium uptake protein [Oscillospiraceae bacterium]MCI9352393.1 TrkA family potassium uptake protein [Lawsonibacter sp.]